MPTLPFEGHEPEVAEDVFIAPGAQVIGDVTLGPGASVWFNSVLRGDVFPIRIGARCNIQDLTMIHVTTDTWATTLEEDVTVGHRAIIHGAHIEHHCLIGMGATIMDGARVGAWSLIGAGALVTPGTQIPPESLVLGAPARVKRSINDAERALLERSSHHYAQLAQRYLAQLNSTS